VEVADEMTDLPARFAKLRLLRDTAAALPELLLATTALLLIVTARCKCGSRSLAASIS